MKYVIGIFMMVIGIALAVYLSLYIMLYGGIMQAVNAWGVNNSDVVWGIIRAVFFEVGAIPSAFIFLIAIEICGLRTKR